ncbi:hypothetical protein KA977_10005, partial [Candidatus Dependentiae bacterium]|nr:hypothetical protein [Candidatus Dependentiae bacterium]
MIVFSGVLEAREVSQSRTDVRSRRGVKSVDSAVQENIEDTSVASTSAATENKGQKIETKVITVKPLQLDKTKKYFIEDGAVYELDLNRESIEKKTENILKLNDYWFAVRPDGHIIAIKKIVNGELTIDNSGITDDRLEIKDSERGIRSRHRMIKSKTQTSTRKTEKRKIKSVGGKETAADEDETAEPEAQQTLPLPELTGDNYYFVGGDGYVYLFDWTKNEIIKFNKYQDSIEQYKAILILRIGEKKIIDVNEGTISDAEYKIDSSKIEEDKTDTQRGLKSRSKLKSAERSSSSTRANASKLKKLKMVDKSKVTNKKNSRSRARGVRSSSDDSSDNTGLELDKNLLNELNLVVDCIYSQINDINLGAEAIINLGAASFKFARIDENNFSGEITLKYLNAGNDLIIPVKGVKKNISQHKLFEFTASVPNPLSNIPAVKDILNNDICSISQSADFIAQFPEKKILQDNLNDSLIIRTPIQLKIDPTKNKLNLFAQLDLKKILEGQNEIPVQFGLTPEQQWQQPFGILPGSVEKFLLSFIYDSKANKASKYKTDIQVRADGFGLIKLDMPELPDFSPNVKINLTFPEININSLFARINDLFSKIGMPKLNFEIGQLALNCNMPSLGSFSFNGLIIPLKFKGFPEMGDIKIDLGVPKLDIDAILNSLEMELAFKFFESFFWKIGLKFPDVGAEFGFNLELVKLNMIRASKTEFKGKLTVKYLNGGKDIVVDATAGLDKAKGRFNVKAKIPNVVKNIPLFDLYEKYLSAIKYPSDYVDVEMWFEPQNQAQKILVSMPFDYAIDPQRGPVKCYINIDLLNKGLKGGLREGERWENPIIVIPPSNIIYLPLTVITDFNIGGSPDFSYMELKTNMKSELLGNVRCDFLYSSQDMEARIDLAADGVTKSRIAELIEKNVKIPKEITQFIGDIVMSLEITNIRAKFDVRSLIQGTPPKYSMKVKYKSAIYEEDFDISVKSLNPAEFIKPICEQIFEKILKNLDKVILKVLENTGKLIAQGATIAFNETSKYAEIAAVEVAKGLESFGKDAGKFFEQGGSEIAETFVDFGNDVAEFFGKKTKETPPIVYGYDMASKIIYKKFSAAAFKLAMTYLENYEKTARVIEKNYEKTLKSLESPEFNAAKSVNPKKFEESIEKLKNDTVFKKWEELKYIAIRDIFKLTNDITSSDVKRFIPANTKEVVYELSDEDFIKLGRDRDIAVNEIKGQVIKWMDTKRESMIKKPPVRKIVYRYTDQYSEVAADISIQILGQTIGSTNLKLLWKPVAPSGWSILGYAMNADARNNQSKPSAKTIIVRNDDYIFRKGYSLQTINTFSEKLTVGKGKLGLVLSGTDASGNSHSFDDVVVPKRSEYFDIGSYAFKNKFAGASYILAKNDVNANIIHCGLGTGPGLDQLLTLNDNAVWTEEQCEKAVAPVRAELTTALDKKDKDAIEKNLAALLELTGYEKNIIPRALQTLLFLDIIEKGESLLYKIETSSNPELFYTIVKDHYNAAISAVSGQQLKSIINNNWKFFKSKSNIAEWLTESVKSYPAYTSAVLANEAKAKLDAAIKVIDFYVNLKQAQLNFANLDKTRALQNLDFLNNNYPDSRQVFKSLRESVIEDINAANKLIALAAEYRQSKKDWELAQTYSKLITINLDDNIKNLLKADVNLKDHISYFFDYRDKISVMHNTFTANFVKAELSDGDWLAGLSAAEKCANFAGQFSYPQLESFIKNNEIFAKPEMANKYYLAIISFIKNRNQITDNLYNYPDKNLTLPFEVICADMEKNIAVLSDYNFIYNDPVYDILKEEYDFLKEKIAGFAVSFNSGKEFMKSYQYAEALKSFIEAGNVIYGDSFGFEFVCQKSPKFDLSTLFSSYLQAYGSFLTDNVYAEISAGNIEMTADDMNIINTMKKWVGTNLNSSNDSTIEKLNSISNIQRLYS